MRLSLGGAWTVRAVAPGPEVPAEIRDRVFAAVVPGCIHTDLLADGAIDDPFDGNNESRYAWIGRTAWRYERTFRWSSGSAVSGRAQHTELVTEGLDTVASIELNGLPIARTANQHRTYRFDIGAELVTGENTIAITFSAPLTEAEKREREHGGELPHVNAHPFNAVRKMASSYGWDWGIDAPTSGIWKPLAIETWSGHRVSSVRPLVDVIDGAGVLNTHIEVQGDGRGAVDVDVSVFFGEELVGSAHALVTRSGVVRVAVPDARLWWPRGHGGQPLYDVRVAIRGAAEEWRGRIGFRTVELDTSVDAFGNRFVMRINGEPITIRGVNWIPDHAFLTEIDRARYAQRIDDAREANVNLIRVWGGGIHESDDFYDLCDEQGILVWQDLLFACAAYAEERWLADEIEAEIVDAVTRLSAHPSLVLWNGNNESYLAYTEWGWRSQLAGRTWGDGYFTDVFPRLLHHLDPSRPYTPGSPFSFDSHLRPNDDANGSVHIWDVWNEKDYTAYREWKPRFVAEFGFQGPPAWSTLTRVVHDDPLSPDGPHLLVHQKAEDGQQKLRRGMLGHLPEPVSMEDWHFSAQLNQAHAIRFGVEYFRSLSPYNTGTILWQLNDNWPAVSWSAVDFDGHRKPMWFALRDAYRPRLATFQPSPTGLELVLVNDSPEDFDGEVRVDRCHLDGSIIEYAFIQAFVGRRSTARLPVSARVATFGAARSEILVATFSSASSSPIERAILNGAEVVHQDLVPAPFVATCAPATGGQIITVTATSFVRDLVVLADRVDPLARVGRGMISLLAGESCEIFVQTSHTGSCELLAPSILRSANQLSGVASMT